MSRVAGHTATASAASLIARLQDWWRHRDEFGGLAPEELEHMASEFGMTGRELQDLAAKGPHAADLLYQRMEALGLSPSDVERIAHGPMRDLERACSCCGDKAKCKHDLAARPDDPAWKDYCPNSASLESLRGAKDGSSS